MTHLITVYGLVQGVGFRPYVKRLADSMALKGTVRNTDGTVGIQITCDTDTLEAFIKRLCLSLPEGASILKIQKEVLTEQSFDDFRIIESNTAAMSDDSLNSCMTDDNSDICDEFPFIPADISTCKNCERELLERADRRYMHPFISCAVCGPRYSIIEAVPYDRERTVMSDFCMCRRCGEEYENTFDRRCYAQTLSCHDCGPELFFNGQKKDAIKQLAFALRNGRIAAVKDIGGYHFVCDARDNKAVERLRSIKMREAKPFAVMFCGMEQIKEYADVLKTEEELLNAPARPIVLLRPKKEEMSDLPCAPLAPSVCGGLPTVGAMLPGNPVQIMLAGIFGSPLVMTSGNISGEPIITDDRVMKKICSVNDIDLLNHNRRILVPLDDSVMHVVCGQPRFIRRARGYVPEPIDVLNLGASDIMAAGGDLKAVFGIARQNRVILSQHFGDMENPAVREAYTANLKHIGRLYSFTPRETVCDRHPFYFSADIAKKNAACTVKTVQHHLAHVMSVAAEHGLYGTYTGIAMDGTGFGTDGAIWGGEIFTVDGRCAHRKYHLRYVDVVGGDSAARDAMLLLKSYLCHAGLDCPADDSNASLIGTGTDMKIIRKAVENGINTVRTSSMGRLFDAVSAMLGICFFNRYEGECAMRLEAAAQSTREAYPLSFEFASDADSDGSGEILFDGLLADIADAQKKGVSAASIARGFHIAVADMIIQTAAFCGNRRILLSGGVFTNRLLAEELLKRASKADYELFFNEKVPAGDGGLALGQIAAAAWGVELE